MATDTDDSRAVMALVLGLLGMMMCAILGPVAWWMGAAVRRDDRDMGREPNGLATVGMILGIVSSVLLTLQLAFVGLYCVFGGFAVVMALLGAAAGA